MGIVRARRGGRCVSKRRRPAGVTTEKSGSLRPDVGRITYGSGVCVGVPAVLRAGRLLLDRSHLTRPISTQLWTTSFPVYDDANPPGQTGSRGFTSCRGPFLRGAVRQLPISTNGRVRRGPAVTTPA